MLSFDEAKALLLEHFARSTDPRALPYVESSDPYNCSKLHSFWLNTHPDHAATSPLRSPKNPTLQRVDLRAAEAAVPLHFFLVTLTPVMDLDYADLHTADDARGFLNEYFPVD